MRARSLFLRKSFISAVCAALAVLLLAGSAAAEQGPHVVVLNSYAKGYRWTDDTVAGFESVFREKMPDAHLAIEYMDTKRVPPSREYFEKLAELYEVKYGDHQPALVVVSDNNALTFIVEYHGRLFPGVPVVFCGVNNFRDEMLRDDLAITGVVEEPDIAATIALMLEIHPETKHIYVLCDQTPTGLQDTASARQAAKAYEGKVAFTFLPGPEFTRAAYIEKLRSLEPDSLALLLDVFNDRNGYLDPEVMVPAITAAAARPVYMKCTAYLDMGLVGGVVTSAQLQGQTAGEMAVEILQGKSVADVPIIRKGPTVCLFDQNALDRWDIDASRLPAECTILNQHESFYHQYRGLVWAAGLTILGLLVIVVALGVNVIRRYRAEQALRSQKRLLDNVMENIPHYIYWKDRDGKFLGCNRKVLEHLGLQDVSEVIGRTDADLDFPPGWAEVFAAADQQVLATGQPLINIEETLDVSDSEPMVVLTSKVPLLNDDDSVAGVLGVAQDISGPRRLEQQLSESEKMRALGQLAGGIAHDFNNVLVAIQGNAQLLRDSVPEASENAELADEILNACRRASGLTQKLLGFARKGRTQDEYVDLQDIVRDVASLLTHSFDRRIRIQCDLQARRALVRGDASQLHSAILNLAVNARDAMPKGGTLTFETRNVTCTFRRCRECESRADGRECIAVTVRDTGTGIEEDIRDRIFEPFFTTKDVGSGTGLGLAAVYGCVQSHRGSIELESTPGEGSAFTFGLPVVDAAADETSRVAEKVRGEGRVLLIDDEEPIRLFASRALRNLGFEVDVQADGAGGLAHFREHHAAIDAVVLDMIMPRIAGSEVLHELRAIKPDIPVCICSGYSQTNVGELMERYDRVSFLAKPFSIESLGATLTELICDGHEGGNGDG